MERQISEIEKINIGYYDGVYSKKNPILLLLHPLVSFDQQSKSRRNFRMLRPFFKAGRNDRGTGTTALDYGFGHGSFLLKLPRSFRVFGTDLSREAVNSLNAVCRILGRRMELFTVDEFDRRTSGVQIDFITCSHVLEHVPDDAAVLRTLAAKLAPKGKILINLPINEVWEDPKHLRKYEPGSIRALFAGCGLTIEKMEECDRWTAFFLHNEMARPLPRIVRPFLRALRLLLGVLPIWAVDALERVFVRRFPPQQILVLAGFG